MKKLYLSLIVAGALVALLPAAGLAAGASGFPTWSSKFTKGRFTLLPLFNNEAVLDKETGLVWEQTPSGGISDWSSAINHCSTIEAGGRKGWRLPTVEELGSVVDTTQSNPALSASHPFTIGASDTFWSATTRAAVQTHAWGLSISNGAPQNGLTKANVSFKAWCVRGGQGIDGVQ